MFGNRVLRIDKLVLKMLRISRFVLKLCIVSSNSFSFVSASGYVEMSRRPETKLVSGDDLEDDFMVEEDNLQIKDAKLGKKKCPKVVKFMD